MIRYCERCNTILGIQIECPNCKTISEQAEQIAIFKQQIKNLVELRDKSKDENQQLKEQLKDMLVFDEPPTQVEWEIMRLEMKKFTKESEE